VAAGGLAGFSSLLLLDPELLGRVSAMRKAPAATPHLESQAFPAGGFFVLRRGDGFALVDCGDVGLRGRGGHGHHDTLSVELQLGGRPVLTDTGCSAYTRSVEERLYCLGASAHNAAVLVGEEPAPASLARLPHAGSYPAQALQWDPVAASFTGRHHGYRSLPGFQGYQRRVELRPDGRSALVEDTIEGSGPLEVAWHFHLAQQWAAVALEEGEAEMRQGSDAAVRFRWRLDGGRVVVERRRTPHYARYGAASQRWCIVIATGTVALPFHAHFELACVEPSTTTS
jgi:hypothetical protein